MLSFRLVLLCALVPIAARAAPVISTEVTGLAPLSPFVLELGLSAQSLGGEWGVGVDAVPAYRPFTSLPLFFGIDFGVSYWSLNAVENGTNLSMGLIGVRALPSAYLHFRLFGAESFRPFVGVGAGPHFSAITMRIQAPSANVDLNVAPDAWELEKVIRIGFTLELDYRHEFLLGTRIGWLYDLTFVMPHTGFRFAL